MTTKQFCKYTIATVAVAAMTGTGLSQEQNRPQTTRTAQSRQQSESEQPWVKARAQEFFRASKLIGKSTQVQTGEKLGDISDVVFNQKGEVFVLVGTGKDKLAAVPWQVFNAHTAKGDQPVVIKSTAQAIASAPSVTEDQWGALNNPQFVQGIYSYYQIQPPGAESMGGSEDTMESSTSGASSSSEASSVEASTTDKAAPPQQESDPEEEK